MAPVDKSKAAGVSASSFFDLKAELAKREEEFVKNKVLGKTTTIVGGTKRPDKAHLFPQKPTVWARQNKGVASRASRDIELETIDKPTLESARAALERKAKIYDKLRKGKSGGLDEKQYEALLVDFDSKPIDNYESDSDDVDESLTVPQGPDNDQDDPIIEYEDEFGRMRTARRSEIPRHLFPQDDADAQNEDENTVIYNPMNHFPIYQPSEERVAAIEQEFSEANNPLSTHYNASAEVRAKGAGFFQFSADEETRARQMEELRAAREETERTRQEVGAMDVKPGQMEGMRPEEVESAGVGKSRALEKRKREIEDRRKLLEAKRRKVKGTDGSVSRSVADSEELTGDASPEDRSKATSIAPIVPQVTTALEHPTSQAAALDAFAVLEQQSQKVKKDKGKWKEKKTSGSQNAGVVDAFLAELEQEIFSKGSS